MSVPAFTTFYYKLNCGVQPADPNGYHANRNKKVDYKIVYRFDLKGKFIGEIKFNKRVCDETGLNYNGIRLAMRPTWSEKRRTLSSMGNLWILKDDYSEEELKRKVQEKKMDSNMNPSANSKAKRIKQICAETKEVIHIWDSLNQAGKVERTGYKLSCICRVLNGSRKTYAGCYWEYEVS